MNYLKIQQQIMKEAMARDSIKKKKFDRVFAESEENVFVTFNENSGFYVIPKAAWYLDTKKVFVTQPFGGIDCMIAKHCDAKFLDDPGISRTIPTTGEKVKLLTLENEDIYIKEKHLEMFDKEGISYGGTDYKSPVYISEYGELVGIVLPVNMKKEA